MSPEPANRHWLREYVDLQLSALRREIDLRFLALAQELVLQAKEYERRLTELNHAHEQARQTLATYVPRDKYDAIREGMEKDIHDLQIYKANSEGRSAVIGAIVGAASSLLVGLVLNYFFK